MILILDFDGVLFNSDKFTEDYLRIFRDLGIPSDTVRNVYRAGKAHTKGYHHVLTRKAASHVGPKGLSKRIEALLKTAPYYLYPDTKKFLQWCRRENIPLFVVSRGPAFQKKKIAASGIARSFKKIVVIPEGSKSEPIQKIMRAYPHERVMFVDDTAEVVDEVKRSLPRVMVMHIARRRSIGKSVYADARIASFAGVMRTVKRNLRG